ncbi:Uncharacterised protein [Burkholderia pseudomallei]|nr:Uncharacterised protein [Burkholderia pseudomallei]CAJ7272884.1 Uncharacterised protein [Burkholderia pseudomallei]CAJ9968996.1 Uncharacterised protein [Burkholderia pseudomallei]
MPAPKSSPKPAAVATQHDAFFMEMDRAIHSRDSRALQMLADALQVVAKITANPSNALQLDEGDQLTHAVNFLVPKADARLPPSRPMQKWERELARVFEQTSFSAIRAEFPGTLEEDQDDLPFGSKEANATGARNIDDYQATHRIHPRLRVLEEWKQQHPFRRLSLENSRDRHFVHRLENAIVRDSKGKRQRSSYDQHIRHVENSQSNAADFCDELFIRSGKLRVVRLILGYESTDQNQPEIFVEYRDAKLHWTLFCKMLSKLECAYMGKIAHSQSRSYYFHLLLFFPEKTTVAEVREQLQQALADFPAGRSQTSATKDAALGAVIGELWQALVSRGLDPIRRDSTMAGRIYNLNAQQRVPSGLGLVSRRERTKREALRTRVIHAMFEHDRYVRLLPPKRTQDAKQRERTFWKGGEDRLPVVEQRKRGRPGKQPD